MKVFNSIDEIDEWLTALEDYEMFWVAIAPYGLGRETRALCDEQIQLGVHESTVLGLVKLMVRWELIRQWGLKPHSQTTQQIRLVAANEGEGIH